MSHFKAEMHQIRFLASVRLSVRVLDGAWHWAHGKQESYPETVVCYDTRPANEVGLFHSFKEPNKTQIRMLHNQGQTGRPGRDL